MPEAAVGYNVIWVFSPDERRALFCLRRKPPFQGLYNLVGGRMGPGESGPDAAYRELCEETGITRAHIELLPLMTYFYPRESMRLEAYAGRLRAERAVREEVNRLAWLDVEEDFFDRTRFAGHGNIGHMYAILQSYGPGFFHAQKIHQAEASER